MALNISAWSIRHPLPPLVVAAAIVALGYISFTKLPITRMPNVDVPVILVLITQFGAAPAEILGRSIANWIDADSIRILDKMAGWEDPSEVNPLPIVLRAKPDEVFDGIIHRVDSDLVLELERGQPGVATSHLRGAA
jgi:hypothetical protein